MKPPARILSLAMLCGMTSVQPVWADQALPTATTPPAAAAARLNAHKSHDKRFNACKAAARQAGVSTEAYQAYIGDCMKKSH